MMVKLGLSALEEESFNTIRKGALKQYYLLDTKLLTALGGKDCNLCGRLCSQTQITRLSTGQKTAAVYLPNFKESGT